MKKKLLLFASMLTLSIAATFAANDATCAVQVKFNLSELTDWSDYETKGVYLYDGTKFYETEYVDSLSDGEDVVFAYNEAVAPFEFCVTLGKYENPTEVFGNYPYFRSVNAKAPAGYSVAFFEMTAPSFKSDKIEDWYIGLTFNEELSTVAPVTKAPTYIPGWEVLDAYIVKTEFGGVQQEKINDNKATINCPKQVTNPWDSQFWIVLPEKLPVGTEFRVLFDYKASDAYTVGTQAHTTPGDYKHWACIGDVKFTKDWQTYDWTGKVGNEWTNDFQSIAFNLSTNKDLVYDIKNLYVMLPAPKTVEEAGWEVLDASLVKTEFGGAQQEVMPGAKGDINCPKQVANPWDSQFWIVLPEALPVGTEFKVIFDYKATSEYTVGTQAHTTPGDYKHWACIGDVKFKTEWQTYEWTGKVGNEWTNDFQSIAFNLSTDKDLVYSIKNLCVKVPTDLTAKKDGWDILNFRLAKTEDTDGPNYLFATQKASVHASAGAANDWDSQFFLVLPEPAKKGDIVHFTLQYKASMEEKGIGTQSHSTPGNYLSNSGIGNPGANWWEGPSFNFTTAWQTYDADFTVNDDNFQSIAFNLSKDRANDVDYYFKNICIKVEGQGEPEPEEPKDFYLKNVSTGKYLAVNVTGNSNIGLSDEASKQIVKVVANGDLLTTTIELDGTSYFLSAGTGFNFKSGNAGGSNQNSGYWYEVTESDDMLITATKVAEVVPGKDYIIFQNYQGWMALSGSLVDAEKPNNKWRLEGVKIEEELEDTLSLAADKFSTCIYYYGADVETLVPTVFEAENNDVIYNTLGQRVNAPVKGINIINGQKVLF